MSAAATRPVAAAASAPKAAGGARAPDSRRTRFLQRRKCACGGEVGPDGECAACRRRREDAQRRSASVGRVLGTGGQALDGGVRRSMESTLGRLMASPLAPARLARAGLLATDADQGPAESQAEAVERGVATGVRGGRADRRHDFRAVRIHTDDAAAEAARAVGARAFTVGGHVVFGRGEFAPGAASGRALLAHELAHVVQQRAAGMALQRKGGTFCGFFANIGNAIANFFTQTDTEYSLKEQRAYLKVLDDTGDIEDDYNSDDKARAVVRAWSKGGSEHVLTAQRKALLIREMLSGATLDDDEDAILELLLRSYSYELRIIFGAGGVKASELRSNLHFSQSDRLDEFFETSFEGGLKAVKAGTVVPKAQVIPLGSGALSQSILIAATGGWDVPCVLETLCSADADVIEKLPGFKVHQYEAITVKKWTFKDGGWKSETVYPSGMAQHGKKKVWLASGRTCVDASDTLVHEVRHIDQDPSLDFIEREIDAYTYTEEWALSRGLPGRPELREWKGGGYVPSADKIKEHVREHYGGTTDTPGELVLGKTASGETEVRLPDGTTTTRPATDGDSFLEDPPTVLGEKEIEKTRWKCPRNNSGKPDVLKRAADGPAPAGPVPAAVGEVLATGGRPLEGATRARFERALGHDFGRVRIHDDARAHAAAHAVRARAFTAGEHVVFAAGRFAPHDAAGSRLLAHELTHVRQQYGMRRSGGPLRIGPEGDACEREADAVASRGGTVPATSSPAPGTVQRQSEDGEPFAGRVPERKLRPHVPRAPSVRRGGGMTISGFTVTPQFCGCEASVARDIEHADRAIAAYTECYRPWVTLDGLYACARRRVYGKDAGKVASAASLSSSSGAIEWPTAEQHAARMAYFGYPEQCWPIITHGTVLHEGSHGADFDAIAREQGEAFFTAFKALEGDEERLEKLREQGFKRETAEYTRRAVNKETVGAKAARDTELKAHGVEKRFLERIGDALSLVCSGRPPRPPQPDVPRPVEPHPKSSDTGTAPWPVSAE